MPDIVIPDWVPPLRERPLTAHKGSMGRLLIVGASPGLTGAVFLAQAAAQRCGAGLVTCAVPAQLGPILEVKTTESMTTPIGPSDARVLVEKAIADLHGQLERTDAVVLGPGMGRSPESSAFFHRFIEHLAIPHVIDADGLWHLVSALNADATGARQPATDRVLTPHEGELDRLRLALDFQSWERPTVSSAIANVLQSTVVGKGPGTVIASPGGDTVVNPTGNPGLASGGTGDVLAGMIGAFLARGDQGIDAARRAVWLHGRAADLAAYGELAEGVLGRPENGYRTRRGIGEESLIASDLIAALPAAILELDRLRPR